MTTIRPILLFLLTTLILALSVGIASAQSFRVIDGDTIKVTNPNQKPYSVRLNGIDAPESRQRYGQRSTAALKSMINGRRISIQSTGKDKYGRTLGTIWINSNPPTNINLEMVRGGHAWHYKKYNSDSDFSNAEQSAKSSNRGLWASSNPQAPWDYRHPKSITKIPSASTQLYMTEYGKKYHRAGCRYLSKSARPVTQTHAKLFSPCLVCNK